MKKLLTVFTFITFFSTILKANGVAIVDASQGIYFTLISSQITAEVENQVAVITYNQTFRNDLTELSNFKFAFPLPEGASATELQIYFEGVWKTAKIIAQEPDTTLPGVGGSGSISYNLESYLGQSPLFYNIKTEVPIDSTITIQLKYVQLLKYEFGKVNLICSNDYSTIQNSELENQTFDFLLTSSRTIEFLKLLNRTTYEYNIGETSAQLSCFDQSKIADTDYNVEYSLNSAELGLFSFSTFQPDTLVPDKEGRGFFTFIVEPDPANDNQVINKVFTLIIDRSGSMGGTKIEQAKNAASFIVENLNEGDLFNIVDFSSEVTNFSNIHKPFNASNKQAALNYISNISANGGTNISGAFERAIPQFSTANDSTANIVVFFTDGEATAGITSTDGILNDVSTLINQNLSQVSIFTFGIGGSVNEQLLTSLATEQNGIVKFLKNNEVENVITDFYRQIRNPVLLSTKLNFSSENIFEVSPKSLPSLYVGQQMIVSGRYTAPENVDLTLTGTKFGKSVQYNYKLDLVDSLVSSYQFLPKVWAKQKIDELMIEYYKCSPGSFQADSLQEYITTISVMYGLITKFTSFSENPTEVKESKNVSQPNINEDFQLLGNYPNPFNPSTQIRFAVRIDFHDDVTIKIFNSIGELVRVIRLHVNGKGEYQVTWDGLTRYGILAPSGIYVYTIDFGSTILSNKMVLMK